MIVFSFFVILAMGQPIFQDSVEQKSMSFGFYQVTIVCDQDEVFQKSDFIETIIEVLLEKLKLFMHDWGHVVVIKNINCIELTKEGAKNEYQT